MREIIFRGKRVDNGEWVKGSLFAGHSYFIQPYKEYTSEGSIEYSHKSLSTPAFKIQPETVGQFTGLTDKDGVKIWEGDIVKFITNGDPLPVEISPKYGARPYLKGYRGFEGWHPLRSEVIGNIHDNPELLEGGKQ